MNFHHILVSTLATITLSSCGEGPPTSTRSGTTIEFLAPTLAQYRELSDVATSEQYQSDCRNGRPGCLEVATWFTCGGMRLGSTLSGQAKRDFAEEFLKDSETAFRLAVQGENLSEAQFSGRVLAPGSLLRAEACLDTGDINCARESRRIVALGKREGGFQSYAMRQCYRQTDGVPSSRVDAVLRQTEG